MSESSFNKIAIIGLGYVGLPLSLQFARSGVSVLGLDIDQSKVDAINAGRSYIKHILSKDIAEQTQSGNLEASADLTRIKEVKAVLICVPTPLKKDREPDLSYVLATAKAIAPHLPKGIVVSLESTTYPGTTEDELKPVLEAGSGLKAGIDFHLVYSPEREDPGSPESQVAEIPKVIGGLTEKCLEKGQSVYSKAIKTLIPVSSCRVAEATKLTENIFRCVNIALVNELKVIYEAMDIDVWEVIAAAKTKPFGYMPFYPGPGLGGHCIPIDPFYLTWIAREHGHTTRFIELAGEINTGMPEHVIKRVAEALNSNGKLMKGSQILILGLAYKANVEDDRESPSYILMGKLKKLGAEVSYYDPHIPKVKLTRAHSSWAGMDSIEWTREMISSFDVILISTAHDAIDYQELANWSDLIIDTRNVMGRIHTKVGQVLKA
jgi:UDP-N-acetyl-D-glucosamine dehydrogenase